MSKFCEHCGGPLEDEAKFCDKCGASAQVTAETSAQPQQTASFEQTYTAPITEAVAPTKKKTSLGLIIAGAAVVIVILGLIYYFFVAGSPTAAINTMFKGMEKADVSTFIKAIPSSAINFYAKDNDLTRKEVLEDIKDTIDDATGGVKGAVSIKFKKTGEESFDDIDFAYLKAEYLEDYGMKITAAKTIIANITIKSPMGDNKSDGVEITVVKVGGRWYCDPNMILL